MCPNATEVVRRLQAAGFQAFIVGGSVRDLILGKVPKDFDVATDATPEQVKAVFPRCLLIGRRFRLAHVRYRGTLVEVATFRGESLKDGEHQQHADGRILRDNSFGPIEEDARRRDFSINALFMDPVTGEIRDYVGGYEDLASRVLRLIGDPETRYREDPVRLLRAARFIAKLGVEPNSETSSLIPELAPLLQDIPPARLFEEVCKLFLTGHATRTLETLQRFELTRALFPLFERQGNPGKAKLPAILWAALANTDQRVAEGLAVTPSFLFAALLWAPFKQRADELQNTKLPVFVAMQRAGDEVVEVQNERVALPRRFASVTREIWLMQHRLKKTRGRRALNVLRHPKFRAGYDFLLLQAHVDGEWAELAEFWTRAQQDAPPPKVPEKVGRVRRRPRRRKNHSNRH